MLFNMEFDICAIAILLLVLAFCLTRHVPSHRSYIFILMVLLETVSIVSGVLVRSSLIDSGYQETPAITVMILFYYMVQYLVPLMFMLYMMVWTGRNLKLDYKAGVMFIIPTVLYFVMMVRNVITHSLYVITDEFAYNDTNEILIMYIMAMYCVIAGIVYAVFYTKALSYSKLTSVSFMGVLLGIGLVVRWYDMAVTAVDFLIAVSLLVMYVIAQNPSDMMDSNTKVMSRSIMDEMLELDMTTKRSFELVVLALDDFKFVNKTFGVSAGDMMLMQVAHFLTTIHPKGKVYRYGADQFALQIRHRDCSVPKALELIEERFRHPWITEDVSIMLSTTVSCISVPEDGDTLENVIDVIDYSILSAKTKGKGSIVYAKDMDLYTLRKEKAIEKAVEFAIERDTFEVHYQPIYNIEKQCYTSAEALVRLRDDRLGNISPDVFIPIAEKNGSIVRMGTMIFEKVCKFISENRLKETSIEYIEINVSVVQCMQHDFAETLISIMEKYGVEPNQINLEVTETAAANSIMMLRENIDKLHEQGISFSLDDYGSGYSTLGYIHQLPFEIIKLDRLMVWDAFANERAGITLKYTVGMLKELKVCIVAEGVETKEQQAHLKNIGCDYLQGWYYSKAVPGKEFLEIIKAA